MKFVLDASVAVAAARPTEPTHAASLARVLRVLGGDDEIVVPAVFPIEVASVLGRTGSPAETVDRFVAGLVAPPTKLVTIGPRAARRIQRVALQRNLRSSDAAYVWLAIRDGVPMVTSEAEVLRLAARACHVEGP